MEGHVEVYTWEPLRAEMRVWTKYVDAYFCPALTVLGAHRAAAFAAKIDKAEMECRIAAMPSAEVRRHATRWLGRMAERTAVKELPRYSATS